MAIDGEKKATNLRIESMKRPIKNGKLSNAKAPTSKRKRQLNPILDVLKNMDEDMVAMLRQTMQEEMDLGPAFFGSQDPAALFAEYIEGCTLANVDEDAKNELLAELVVELGDLKVESNGGRREAREKIQAIYDLLDNAIEGHALHPIDLMITAKVFTDAGWAVPDSLKQAVAEALQVAAPDAEGVAGNDTLSSLFEAAELAGQNPFDVYENLNSIVVSLPSEASVILLSALIAGGKAVIDQAVAGFMLHPDTVVAQAVGEALAASAAQTPVESTLIERLVRVRTWLPQTRQADFDATIRDMRLNALPPVKAELPKVTKCYVSVCDGAGTRSLFVTQRIGAHYQIASVMMKLDGVADAMILRELPKSGMDDIVRQMKSSVLVMETDLTGITRMLGLAIADNCASGNLPPFKLVEVVESLGLGQIHPDHASPMDIVTGLLADLPAEQTSSIASAKAHADMLDNEFEHQWFEAGEALEDLLYPVKGSKQRVAKLMKDYLPERRQFWARQCAISALAMRDDQKTRRSFWKQLALVGRDIASDMPLDQIPLMKQVAEISVRAFESQL
jgi:hypothetical protein